MMILLKDVINERPVQSLKRRINWETMLKTCDYQNISNPVYFGMIGIEKNITADCEARFYQRYKKEMLLRESYQSAEEVILWQLEKYKIHSLLLSSASICNLYPRPELGYIDKLEILVGKKDLPMVLHLMRDMDYEEKQERMQKGILFVRQPGIRVAIYDEPPVESRVLREVFQDPVRKYLHFQNYKFIHVPSMEEEYIYRLAKIEEAYLNNMLKVRQILDFWLYRQKVDEEFLWKEVHEYEGKAKLQEFVKQIEILSVMWFGGKGNHEYSIALELEEYILSKDKESRELDAKLLPFARIGLDFYNRDREEEWMEKRKEWFFPPREYMEQFFPILKKYPFLLAFFWIVRDVRLFRRVFVKRCKRLWERIRSKVQGIRERLHKIFRRKKEEEAEGEGDAALQEAEMQEVSEELLETGAEEVANASEEAAAVETVEESDVSISEEK
ncbi:MAG: nucleotidyltransferase family protein [Dorea sp.]|nr:nucleotidyltransferase family protein [Dorea sp.]